MPPCPRSPLWRRLLRRGWQVVEVGRTCKPCQFLGPRLTAAPGKRVRYNHMGRLESWVVCQGRAYGPICYVCNGHLQTWPHQIFTSQPWPLDEGSPAKMRPTATVELRRSTPAGDRPEADRLPQSGRHREHWVSAH